MKEKVFLEARDLNKEIIQLIIEKYPNGIRDNAIVSIQNTEGNYIKVIVLTYKKEQLYIKVSSKLKDSIDQITSKNIFPLDTDFDLYFDEFT